jgi:hypothetical protein
MIRNHVLLEHATLIGAVDESLARALQPDVVAAIVDWIPESWLSAAEPGGDVAATRVAYVRYLLERATAPRPFVEEALRVR